jgi:hypothetical protein
MVFTAAVLAGAGCRPAEGPIQEAALFIVEDMMSRAPQEHTHYLADHWIVSSVLEPLPPELLARMQEMSGLPVAPPDFLVNRDSSMMLLYLFRPTVVRSDSVLGLAGWMSLVGGDGDGAWALEYAYRLDCRRRCRNVIEAAESVWN